MVSYHGTSVRRPRMPSRLVTSFTTLHAATRPA